MSRFMVVSERFVNKEKMLQAGPMPFAISAPDQGVGIRGVDETLGLGIEG